MFLLLNSETCNIGHCPEKSSIPARPAQGLEFSDRFLNPNFMLDSLKKVMSVNITQQRIYRVILQQMCCDVYGHLTDKTFLGATFDPFLLANSEFRSLPRIIMYWSEK